MKYNCKNYIRVLWQNSDSSRESVDGASSGNEKQNTANINSEILDNLTRLAGFDAKSIKEILISKVPNSPSRGAVILFLESKMRNNPDWKLSAIDKSQSTTGQNEDTRQLLSILNPLSKTEPSNSVDVPNKKRLTPEQWKKVNEIKENHPIDLFITDIVNTALSDRLALEKRGLDRVVAFFTNTKQILDIIDKQESILESASPRGGERDPLKEYRLVLDTMKNIVKSDTFRDLTGPLSDGKDNKYEKGILKSDIHKIIKESIEKETPGSMKGVNIVKLEELAISDKDKEILKENPPNTLYTNFVDAIKKMDDDKTLTKEELENYIEEKISKLLPILNSLGNESYKKTYNDIFISMKALAGNEILTSALSQLSGWFSGEGKNFDSFLDEAKKAGAYGGKGSVGKDGSGKWKFYTPEDLKGRLMNDGQVTDGEGFAWKSLIVSTHCNKGELEGIFGQDGMKALALYLDNNKAKSDSTILTELNDTSLKKDFIKLLDNYNTESNQELSKLGVTEKNDALSIDDFPELMKVINSPRYKGLKIEKLPMISEGVVDTPQLIRNLIQQERDWGKAVSEELLKELKEALRKDTDRLNQKSENKIQEHTKILGGKKIKELLDELEINFDKIIIDCTIDKLNLTKPQLDELILKSKSKRDAFLDNPEKLKKLDAFIALLTEISNKSGRNVQQNTAETLTGAEYADTNTGRFSLTRGTVGEVQQNSQDGEIIAQNGSTLPKEILVKYGLPEGWLTDDSPQMHIIIDKARRKLLEKKQGKDGLDEKEKTLLISIESRYLYLIRIAEIAQDIREHEQRYGLDSQSSIGNLGKINSVYNIENIERNRVFYEHINTYSQMGQYPTNLQQALLDTKPGESISIGQYYRTSDISGGLQPSIPIDEISCIKDSASTVTIHFPSDYGISPISGIPIAGIQSFLTQTDIFARLNCHTLVQVMQQINPIISKATGKETNWNDGKFDPNELERTMRTIARLLDIKILPGSNIIDISNSVRQSFPAQEDVSRYLISIGVLNPEGDFKEFAFRDKISESAHSGNI